MAYFNPAKQTEVLVDGSPVGVGAILAQEEKSSLTPAER